MPKKITTEEFIERARQVHGDKYDYSKVVYVNTHTNVTIICPEHGGFQQMPSNHLRGAGCSKCHYIKNGNRRRKSMIDFIEQAKNIHHNKYDYSKVIYVNSDTKIIIICPEHGEFLQVPFNHLCGAGCPKCSGKHKPTTKEFIQNAKAIHGDKYDYSKVEYISNLKKVKLICLLHGEFEQTPAHHILRKQGCPICSENKIISHISYVELKKIIQSAGIKTYNEYMQWWSNNKEYCRKTGIPLHPNRYFKNQK